MKIEVKNFGPIKKGTIDLDKRVTVFVGYNNSGKTYMSQLLWGLNFSINPFLKGEGKYMDRDYFHTALVDKDSFSITQEIVHKLVEKYTAYLVIKDLWKLFNVKDDFFSRDSISIDLLDDFTERIRSADCSSFALLRTTEENPSFLYSEYFQYRKPTDSLEVIVERKHFDTPLTLPEAIRVLRPYASLTAQIAFNYELEFKNAVLRIMSSILFKMRNSTFFLPASRVFYPSYYKYIYSIAKEENDLIGEVLGEDIDEAYFRALSKKSYTKPVDNLIQLLYGLDSTEQNSGGYGDLLEDLSKLVGGDIIIKATEGIAPLHLSLKLQSGKEIDMYMSSSSANQLTTLYLYLKYWAKEKNNFLIIDEPEENLHPENQIKLVNLLMKFADRNNNKILITTHSPLITDLINNYANLSYLKDAGENISEIISEDASGMYDVKSLKTSDFGVYFFSGDSIQEYKIDEYGTYFQDFQQAEDKVKSTSNSLLGKIYHKLHPDA